MSEAERSIAIKRKIAVTKPISREDSPSEVYTPKRRKSETGVAEVSPPPYIPSKKEPPAPRVRSLASQDKERYTSVKSKQDARHILERKEHSRTTTLPSISRERQELISRSRHIELFRRLGINRTELIRERERRKKDTGEEISVKREIEERERPDVRNFTITAHIAPSSRSSESVRDRLSKVSEGKERSLQVTLHPSATSQRGKGTITSRLGKVVIKRSSSDDKTEEHLSDDRPKTRVNLSTRGRRLALSLLGKEVVKRQCEAAVLSVKSGVARSFEHLKVQDSRVVESHSSSSSSSSGSDDEESDSVQEKLPSLEIVKPTLHIVKDSEKPEDGHDKDSEDLDDMLIDDLEPDLLQDSLTDEFTLDLEDDDDLIKVVGQLEEEDLVTDKDKPSSSGTRFIVTLDGVDERQFEGNQDSLTGFMSAGPNATPLSALPPSHFSGVSKPMAQTSFLLPQDPSISVPVLKPAPPKIQPFSISLKDSDDEVDDKTDPKAFAKMPTYPAHPIQPTVAQMPMTGPADALTTLQKAKQSERCKFWPACAAGSECEFYHPTSYCKTFPNCKFGDKCLFIHPNCKFDSKCTRIDCPFTHTSRRPVLAAPAQPFKMPAPQKPSYYPQYIPFSNSASQAPTVCKFYPNCHNVNCPFVHPKPCRFGVSCQNAGCPFFHPATPSKEKLKWTAQTDPQQLAKDGVGLTSLPPPPPHSSLTKPPPPPRHSISAAGSSAVSSTSV